MISKGTQVAHLWTCGWVIVVASLRCEMQAKAANVSAARKLYNKALATDHSHQQAILGLATLEGRSRNHGKVSRILDPGDNY